MQTQEKMVRTQEKGLVTIPIEFRERLGIEKNSLLQAKLTKDGVLFVKVTTKVEKLYSDEDIKKWMQEDRLDGKTLKKLDQLLGTSKKKK